MLSLIKHFALLPPHAVQNSSALFFLFNVAIMWLYKQSRVICILHDHSVHLHKQFMVICGWEGRFPSLCMYKHLQDNFDWSKRSSINCMPDWIYLNLFCTPLFFFSCVSICSCPWTSGILSVVMGKRLTEGNQPLQLHSLPPFVVLFSFSWGRDVTRLVCEIVIRI